MRSVPQYSRELRLLVASLRRIRSSADMDALRQHLGEPLNWTQVLALAQRHRLIPHLYLALKNCSELIPQDAWSVLRDRFRSNASHNLRRMSELIHLMRSFEAEGIPSFPIKGPVLAVDLYGGLECRQFRDLDLAVPPEHAIRAVGILQGLGYETRDTELPQLTPRQQQQFLANNTDLTFHKSTGATGIILELHWRLPFGLSIPTDFESKAMKQIDFNHGKVPVLPAAELTLFLAHHGASHRFFRLSWMADLLQSIERLSLAEWESLYRRSLDFGCDRQFLLGLIVLSRLELLRDPVPTSLQMIGRKMRGMEILVRRVLEAIADSANESQHPLRVMYWTFQLGGWRDALQQLATLFAPHPCDAYGHGTVQAHWRRLYRVLKEFIRNPTANPPNVPRQRAA